MACIKFRFVSSPPVAKSTGQITQADATLERSVRTAFSPPNQAREFRMISDGNSSALGRQAARLTVEPARLIDRSILPWWTVASLQRAGERFGRDVHAARGEGLGGHG